MVKLFILSTLSFCLSCALAQSDSDLDQKVQRLLQSMTLEQKVAQMIQAEIQYITPEEVATFQLGSILNGGGSYPNRDMNSSQEDWVKLAQRYYQASIKNGGIPILWGTDAVHGHNNVLGATIFPHNIGLGATRNAGLLKTIGSITAKEVLATGIDWIFAPTVAVTRNDRWGRTYESYSEQPEIVKAYARQMVLGMQGEASDFLDTNHVIATAKHFVGDGGTVDGVDQGNNLLSEKELIKIHAQGYISSIASDVQVVMASFNSWNGEKIHGHKYLLTDLLKEKMGFDGFVVGDWNGHGQVKGCRNDSCPQAINAGVDMIMVPQDWKAFYWNTLGQVKSGEISISRVNDAVSRILKVKVRAGLFEKPSPLNRKLTQNKNLIGSAKHLQVAKRAVRESLVLLKNKNGILPLDPSKKYFVTGRAADDIGMQCGGWTLAWQGVTQSNHLFPNGSSIYDGVVQKVGFENTERGVDANFKNKPDIAIVVFGEKPYAEGQGDISHLSYRDLYPQDITTLKQLKQKGIPTVVVFLTGRPMWVNPELNQSNAFVVAWLPGSQGGAIADVLFQSPKGENHYDFQGKLSFSWPARPTQTEIHPSLYLTDKPLFEYGYGLSYSDEDQLGDNLPEDYDIGDSDNQHLIFSGRAIFPYTSFLKVESRRLRLTTAGDQQSFQEIQIVPVDKDIQEDARRISVNSKIKVSYFFESADSNDLSLFHKGQLEFDVRLDSKQSFEIDLLVGCNNNKCLSKVLESHLKSAKIGEWQKVMVDLKNYNLSDVKKMIDMSIKGKVSFSVANIKLRK